MFKSNLTFASEQPEVVLLNESAQRARFEARIRHSSFGKLADWVLMRFEDGTYKDRQIQHRWEDWQICEAGSRQTIAELQEKLCNALMQQPPAQPNALNIDVQAVAESLALLRNGLDSMKESLGAPSTVESAVPAEDCEEATPTHPENSQA